MRTSVESVERYVRETLHFPLQLRRSHVQQTVPLLLQHQYDFYEAEVLNHPLLLMFATEIQTPASIKKQLAMVPPNWRGSSVLVSAWASPSWRSRMIEQAIPFIVPNNQMYLPMLALDLRERFPAGVTSANSRLSPSAQVVLLHSLQEPSDMYWTPTEVARQLHYSAMSVGRAVNQLESTGLVDVSRRGRERRYRLAGDARRIWDDAQPVLTSPVSAEVPIACGAWCEEERALPSGLTALAGLTRLAETIVPTFAMERSAFKDMLDDGQATSVEAVYEADRVIEIWKYSPWRLTSGPYVDRFSLYLSMRDNQDERVQSALRDLMAGAEW